MNIYLFLVFLGVLASSLAQILLKSSANSNDKLFLNFKVIFAYGILFTVMFINSYFLFKHVELSKIAIIESLSYIFIPILSFIFFKEKLSKKQLLGISLIVVGVIIYSL